MTSATLFTNAAPCLHLLQITCVIYFPSLVIIFYFSDTHYTNRIYAKKIIFGDSLTMYFLHTSSYVMPAAASQ